ncbi:MAG: hypothetical protein KGI78_00655 [Patescibacteria group bacterium]|nr:hypothetical protein [Patescibacteria group bacterium]
MPDTAPRGITGLVIRWGLAKDARSAGYVLLGTAVGVAVLAFVMPMVIGGGGRSAGVPQSVIDAKTPSTGTAPSL